MKTFIFTVNYKPTRYSRDVTLAVYRVKRNKPQEIGYVKFQSQSCRGEKSEALNWLVQNKHLPKKCARDGGYVNYEELGKSFELYELN